MVDDDVADLHQRVKLGTRSLSCGRRGTMCSKPGGVVLLRAGGDDSMSHTSFGCFMKDSFKYLIGLGLALSPVSILPVATAQASYLGCDWYDCAAPGAAGSSSSTQAFIGLRWDFGAKGPAVTGGVRYLKSNDDDGVYGAQFDASLPLTGDTHLPKLRLLGLFGSSTVQGQLGGGYDFAKETFIISAGLQGPYLEGGLDYGLDGSFAPYIGINSLKKPELGGGAACPADYTLIAVTDNVGEYLSNPVYVDDQYISGGQACISGSLPPP
jgi:hypothetical protein